MKNGKAFWLAAGAGLLAYLLLRRNAAAATTGATSSGSFSPIGLASTYFDPGESFTVDANVSSSSFGQQLNVTTPN